MNREEFKEIVDNNEYVVIKFGASWCGPCKQIARVLEEVTGNYQDSLKYISLDVEESTDVTGDFKIRNVPTILFLKKGEVIDKCVGSVSRQTLVDKIEQLISE
jgi:thioredoxin 1